MMENTMLLDEKDFKLELLEEKLNKLVNIKVEPYIDCIVNQYFLTQLGGDHYTIGIIKEIDMYINKTVDILKNKTSQKHAKQIKSESVQLYEKYIDLSQKEIYSIKFEIYEHHKDQLKTYKLLNENIVDSNEHILKLKQNKKNIEININLEKDSFFQKLLESQIGVIEQQIDLFR